MYERLDRPILKPLPQESYELSTWKRCRVNIDYHVEVENNLYSVPYQLIHEKVEARVTASVVEVLFKGKRVASHPRKKGKGHYSTNPEHMPRSHREHLEWTPSRLLHWAEQSGRATGRLVAGILESRPHPEQGFRSCLGVMRLGSRNRLRRHDRSCLRVLFALAMMLRSLVMPRRTTGNTQQTSSTLGFARGSFEIIRTDCPQVLDDRWTEVFLPRRAALSQTAAGSLSDCRWTVHRNQASSSLLPMLF